MRDIKDKDYVHYLKQKNDIELYHKYLLEADSYTQVEKNREIVYKKYPELKEILENTVLNKKFGNVEDDEDATDISNIIEQIESAMKTYGEKQIDVIIGGPPCQAYSIIGRSRMKEKVKDDNRNYLFYYYRDIVSHFKPKMFIFENVPGIFTAMEGKIFEEIKEKFAEIGYELKTNRKDHEEEIIKDTSKYGVYQTRKRVILFGYKREYEYEYPDFYKYALKFDEEMTTQNVIGDLNDLQPGEGEDRKLVKYKKGPISAKMDIIIFIQISTSVAL